MNNQRRYGVDPEDTVSVLGNRAHPGLIECVNTSNHRRVSMFVIQALHPEGWIDQGTAQVEYWAYQEAQVRCCSDGRAYRIINADDQRVVSVVSTNSCRADQKRVPAAIR